MINSTLDTSALTSYRGGALIKAALAMMNANSSYFNKYLGYSAKILPGKRPRLMVTYINVGGTHFITENYHKSFPSNRVARRYFKRKMWMCAKEPTA